MRQHIVKTFIKVWDSMFSKHPWIEAFLLSIIVHLLFLNILWFCCQIHVMMFPATIHQKIIEIEFLKNEM